MTEPTPTPALRGHRVTLRVPVSPSVVVLVLVVVLALAACSEPAEGPAAEDPTVRATELVRQGREAWKTRQPDELRRSLELFEEATDLAPDSAPAWSGLADAAALVGLYSLERPEDVMPRALEAAERALELDPDRAGTLASLGLARYLYSWDFTGAEDAFLRSLELAPRSSTTRHWYAMLLSATNRDEEALEQIRRAGELAPDSPLFATKLATLLTTAGRLDAAAEQMESVLSRFPDYGLAHREHGLLLLELAQPELATEAFRRSLGLAPTDALAGDGTTPAVQEALKEGSAKTVAALVVALGRQGGDGREEARHLLEVLRQRADEEYVPSLVLARALAGVGEREAALQRIETALEERDPGLVYLHTKPGFESLEDDPRFEAVAEAVGVAPDPVGS